MAVALDDALDHAHKESPFAIESGNGAKEDEAIRSQAWVEGEALSREGAVQLALDGVQQHCLGASVPPILH